jgi:hypothetical protein
LSHEEWRPQGLTSQLSVPTNEDLQKLVKDENDESRRMSMEAMTKAMLIEPNTYEEAMKSAQKIHWIEAMKKEGTSLKEHGSGTRVPLPIGKDALTVRWIYKIKYDANGNIERYKARLVIIGFEQV